MSRVTLTDGGGRRVSFDGSDWVLKVPADGVKQSICVDDIELFRGVRKDGMAVFITGAYCYRGGRDYILDGGVEYEVLPHSVECRLSNGDWVPLTVK
jgi:hypothetical protein